MNSRVTLVDCYLYKDGTLLVLLVLVIKHALGGVCCGTPLILSLGRGAATGGDGGICPPPL